MADEIASIGIDPTAAVEGAKKVNAAFDSISKAADKLATSVSSKFNKLSSATDAINKLAGPSTGAVNRLNALSSALSNFKPPTATQIKNLSGLNSQLIRMSGIKIPASIRTTLSFLGAYKGPTARSGQNAAKLFTAISSFKPPTGLKQATLDLERMANAATRAATAVSQLSSRFTGLSNGGQIVFKNTSRIGNNFEQLGRRAGFLENSLLRTQYALQALGGVLAASVIIQTASAMQSVESSLNAVTGSAAKAAVQLGFVKRVSNELSIDFLTTAKSFSLFLASTKGTNFSVADTQKVFRQVSIAARVLNLSVSDTEGVFRALQQIISKGSLQSEELRQQLGDRLPGAFNRMAAALKVTTAGLQDMLKKGQVTGEKLKVAMQAFGQSLENDFARSVEKASKTVSASFARLKNAFTFAVSDVGKGGLNDLIIGVNDALAALLQNKSFNNTLAILASALGTVASNLNVVVAIVAGVAVSAFATWAKTITLATFSMTSLGGVLTAFGLLARAGALGTLALGSAAVAAAGGVASMAGAAGGATVATAGLGVASTFATTAMIRLRAAGAAFVTALGPLLGLLTTAGILFYSMAGGTNEASSAFDDLQEFTDQAGVAISEMSNRLAANTGQLEANTLAVGANLQAKLQAGLVEANLARKNDVKGATFEEFSFGQQLSAAAYGVLGVDVNGGKELDARAKASRGSFFGEGNLRTADRALGTLAKDLDNVSDVIKNPKKYAKSFQLALDTAGGLDNYVTSGGTSEEIRRRENATSTQRTRLQSYIALGGGLKAIDIGTADLGGTNLTESAAGGGGGKGKGGAGDQAVNLQRFTDAINDYKTSLTQLKAVSASGNANDAFKINIDSESVKDGEQAYKDYLDAISSASPKRAAEATAALTAEFNKQGIAGKDLKEKFIELAKVQADTNRRKEVVDSTASLKLENQLLEKNISVIGKGPEAVAKMQIETELLKISIEKQIPLGDEILESYRKQLEAQQKLTAEKEFQIALEQANQNNNNLRIAIGETAAGGSVRDVADRIRLRQKEAELTNTVADATQRQVLLTKELDAINYERVLEDVNKEYEAQINLAEDLSQAIVGAYKNGIDSGQGFVKTMKSIFKSAKDIILDFYLYQPLQEGLKGLLTPNYNSSATVTMKTEIKAIEQMQQDGSEAILDMATKVGESVQDTLREVSESFGSINANTVQITAGSVNLGGDAGPAELAQALQPQGVTGSNGDPEIVVNASPGFLQPIFSELSETLGAGQVAGLTKGLTSPKSPFSRLGNVLGLSGAGFNAAKQRSSNLFGPETAEKLFGKSNPIIKFGKDLFKADSPLGKIASKVGPALESAGAAFAAFSAGKGIGKALGLGKVGSSALGGAAAGFQLGGPVGAAIGAVVGGIVGFLKKVPSSYANITTDGTGLATISKSGKTGKGKKEAAEQLASGGIAIFTDFAQLSGSQLLPNKNLGTFGQYKNKSFFSSAGKTKKGKPKGQEGIDYIYGTEEQLQIFALKNSIRGDNYSNLSGNYKTVAANSKAGSLNQFNEDLSFVKTYEDLIAATSGLPQSFLAVRDLLKTYDTAITKAKQLGLAEDKLVESRTKALAQLKKDFDDDINQQILEITDPKLGAFNALKKEYEEAVYAAAAVGGNILAVEQLYNLKREALISESFESAYDNLKEQADNLLRELTATTSSPLSAIVTQGNAAAEFERIRGLVTSGGNYSEVDLNAAVNNLLETSRAVYASSSGYFNIFNDVTEFLRSVSNGAYAPGGTGTTTLPGLQTAAQVLDTLPIIEATNLVGAEIVRGNTTQEQLLTAILAALKDMVNGVPATTTPGVGTGAAPSGFNLNELIRLGFLNNYAPV
jgi:tape measure domain-containing protein